ncbi:MAG: hypothetical protein DMF64_19970 [Acidobacteria bacterium]|nr:MAG: hypothetical protein DMF64_19970 [Acidobacteriota bacterium]
MVKKKAAKRRTQVKDLPKKEKALSKEGQKKIKGGAQDLSISLVGGNPAQSFKDIGKVFGDVGATVAQTPPKTS